MLFPVSIGDSSSISEGLERIHPSPLSDMVSCIGAVRVGKDLFAERGPRKAWHSERSDLARCDLSQEHVHLFPKSGVRITAVWRRTVKGPTLAEIKSDDDKVPLFASRLSEAIRSVLGVHLDSGGYALVTTPRRRHKERNFACMVASATARLLSVAYYEDAAIARTKQRIGVDFSAGNIPRERNLIVIDDFVTTGSTLGAMNRLLSPLGKNCIYFVGVDNQ